MLIHEKHQQFSASASKRRFGKIENQLATDYSSETHIQLQVENGGEIGLANLFMTYFPHSQSSGWTFVMGIVRMCDFKGLTLVLYKMTYFGLG